MAATQRIDTLRNPPALAAWALAASALFLGCDGMSASVQDESVGLNGGFEHVRDGLPVNWLVYSPTTVPTGDFELGFDTLDFKEGTQSLKFVVRECSDTGGWLSPGFTREVPAQPGETYAIRFWIRNDGCEYVVSAGGVDAFTGELTAIDSSQGAGSPWRRVESLYVVPERYGRLRLELSIRSPGALWIDDVQIERLAHESDDG